MMKSSSRATATGCASLRWTQPVAPSSIRSPSSIWTRATVSDVPVWNPTSAPCGSGRDTPARIRTRTSTARVGRMTPGSDTTAPRPRSSVATPAKLIATRRPGRATSTLVRWLCSPRARVRSPSGSTSSSCPTSRLPSRSVPVTIVPNPAKENTRSTGIRGRPRSRRTGA